MSWRPTQSIWNEAARKAREKRKELCDSAAYRIISDPNMSILQAEVILLAAHRRESGAAKSTVDALMYSLRRGLSALEPSDPLQKDTLRRLSELTATQLRDCCENLQKRKPEIGAAWNAGEVGELISAWKELRHE